MYKKNFWKHSLTAKFVKVNVYTAKPGLVIGKGGNLAETLKNELEKMIYTFRYYCLLPFSSQKYIKDIEELQEPLKKAMNSLIDNSIDREIITNFSDSASLCYTILKNIFYTKIIELKEVEIKITNTKKEKSEKETTYYITINIYDLKDAQEKECTTVNNLNQLNVKVDKKIPIFIKGKK